MNRAQSRFQRPFSLLLAMLAVCVAPAANARDALPSWNDGPPKQAILAFVAAVTKKKGLVLWPVSSMTYSRSMVTR